MKVAYNDNRMRRMSITKAATSDRGMQKGEVFKGEILDIKQNNVTIRLSNGQNITAKLTEQFEFTIGQKVLFQVKDANAEQLILKPMSEELMSPKDSKAYQALEEAGVVVNKENVKIVEQLIQNNLPIDKNFINKVLQYNKKFKDTSIDNIILFLKNDMTVSKENIQQLNNYMNNNNSLKQDILSLMDKINNSDDNNLKQELLKILSFNTTENINSKEMINSELSIGKNNIDNIDNLDLGELLTKSQIATLKDKINNTILKNSGISFKIPQDLNLKTLQLYIETLDISGENKADITKTILDSLTENAINKSLFLDEKALDNPKLINNYYNEIYDKLLDIFKLTTTSTDSKNIEIASEASKFKNNIEFMNELNNNYTYMQLPFKINDRLLKSELYIFQNKKQRKRDTNQLTTLLRLNYAKLGHLDVYVAKSRNNIDCKFYVEDEDKKNIINKHLNTLHRKLKDQGYNITGLIVINNDKEFDFVKDFLDRKSETSSIKRYSFDMRV